MATPRHSSPAADSSPWLTLTDLGRLYGISAVHCGRLLQDAGLRSREGLPTAQALRRGCAPSQPQPFQAGEPIWHRQHCRQAFEAVGLVTVQRASLVQQWAALLSALSEGSPSISTSAAQMAEELPDELVDPVNRELQALGCSFQVQQPGHAVSRRGGGARSAASRGTAERPIAAEVPAGPVAGGSGAMKPERSRPRNHAHGPAGRGRRHGASD